MQVLNRTKGKLINVNFRAIILLGSLLYGLAIFQDYLFSKFKSTGFYWSDTMLYNIYWLIFIPYFIFALYAKNRIKPQKTNLFYCLAFALTFSSLHIFSFTLIFILGSNIIYTIPHRFITIFKNAISNQSQITFVVYFLLPILLNYLQKKKTQNKDITNKRFITIKNGIRRIKIDAATVLFIKTDRPYTAIFSNKEKFLHDESLKELEKNLDSKTFIRVHRSVIINKNHITGISSRKNGDYDAILCDQHSVRFSRHYRQNWSELLNH
jgi:hypothetical protein